MSFTEAQLEQQLIDRLVDLKYAFRPDVNNRAALEKNFRAHFEALNKVKLTDDEFARLLGDIVTPDVFTAAHTLRHRNSLTRDDGTPLNYTLVNLQNWCKKAFEVVSQLKIYTNNNHHWYNVVLLISGVPCVPFELITLSVNPRRAKKQIVE